MSGVRLLLVLFVGTFMSAADGGDWPRFRGPNGSGVSSGDVLPPVTWSETENVKWKTDMPGPGLSCPIVTGNRVIVTCWTGYAVGAGDAGSIDDLKRNVHCLNRENGKSVWTYSEDAVLPEDPYRGMFAQNGYASHTPATDGRRVYVFFGKTGVLALDLNDGRKLWQKSVGENLEDRGWGSASSPIVYRDSVIVPAFIEGDCLVAFDGETGDVKWKQETPGYRSTWSTPILVELQERTDLVIAVPGEIWGLSPDSGKLRWYCEVPGSDSARASVVADGDVVIAMPGGRGSSTSVAVRAGGRGAVEPLWTGRDVSEISTPVIRDGQMYLVSNKVATSVDMKTGKRITQARLTGSGSAAPTVDENRERSGRGGRDYSSPVLAGQHLYYATRSGDFFVVEVGETMKQIALNSFESDRTDFSATPAVCDGELYLRSSKAVYCIAKVDQ